MIQAADEDEDEDRDDNEVPSKNQKTISGAFNAIWKREGLLGFYKGLKAQILKTVLSSALLLMIKEKVTKTAWVLMLALKRFLSISPNRLKSAWLQEVIQIGLVNVYEKKKQNKTSVLQGKFVDLH